MKRTYFYLFGLVMTLTSCVNGIAPQQEQNNQEIQCGSIR